MDLMKIKTLLGDVIYSRAENYYRSGMIREIDKMGQAIDCSHPIGQTRRVIAYKYIVKNTIEEKMLELQNKKKKLVDDIISDESTLLTSLSRDEIMDLFG
jgi:hypothetical protein